MKTAEPRYTGMLRLERRDYGFLINVKDATGKSVQPLDGEGYFLRISEAKRTLGNGKNLLLGLNGTCLSFSIRDSQMFQGKKEACDVHDPTANRFALT
ncbi:MAG: hypothetical protein AAB804_02720 [Patescibacteria group bacterium]